jgi:hypothetical protein
VSFSSNGDPALSDGSAGSGVNPSSVPASQTFSASGSHTACGTVSDNAGNVSSQGCATVQVDASPPELEVSCPAMVPIGAAGVHATVTASDPYSGLSSDPSGSVPISTATAGAKTVTRTAISNVGYETTRSCTTVVGYYVTITGPVNGSLIVRSGEAVELASTAKVSGSVTVRPGGALDIEGAKVTGSVNATRAALLRVCGATIGANLKSVESPGALVIGDGTAECTGNSIGKAGAVKGNTSGVLVQGNSYGTSLLVTANKGGTTVTNNHVGTTLTVTGNEAPVVDRPNTVGGRSKLQ